MCLALIFNIFCTALSPDMAGNVLAAWRQAGVLARFGREREVAVRHFVSDEPHPRLRQTACYATPLHHLMIVL